MQEEFEGSNFVWVAAEVFKQNPLEPIFWLFTLTKNSCQKSKQSFLDILLSIRSLIVLLILRKDKEIIAEDKEDFIEGYLNEKNSF